MLSVHALDHIVLNVSDVQVSANWYERVLGMTRSEILAPSGETRVSMMFGVQKMNLRPIAITQETWFTGRAPCPGSDDLCFLTDTAPDDVTKHLIHCEVAIELGPVAKSGALGPIRSVYVRDPDGNLVEISSYA